MSFSSFLVRKLRLQLRAWHTEYKMVRADPTLHFETDVQLKGAHRIFLGRRVRIQRGVILHGGGFEWSGGQGEIQIGKDSVISPYCILFGAGGIHIGERFDCGPGTMILSSRSTYHEERAAGSHRFDSVHIGNDVVVYAGCIIAPGVRIGDNAVVGAGSVVLRDVASDDVVAGSPARSLRARKDARREPHADDGIGY